MMILPLADTLQNCLQNLTSRIAGLDSEQMTGRAMGMGAMLGFGIGAIKEQFKTPTSNNHSDTNNTGAGSGLTGFISRAKSVISPSMNLSDSTDYNGNANPIRDVIPKSNAINNNSFKAENTSNNEASRDKFSKAKSITNSIARTGFNATKTYLQIGANMAEGNFDMNKNPYKMNNKNNSYKSQFQNTEYVDTTSKLINTEKGDEHEFKGKS